MDKNTNRVTEKQTDGQEAEHRSIPQILSDVEYGFLKRE